MDADLEAMQQLQAGDDSALTGLMTRWEKPLLAFVFRYLGSQEDAIDIAQETFARVYTRRHDFKGHGKFASWLFCIAANLCRNHLRWRSRHPTQSLDAEDASPQQHKDPASLPWENAQSNEMAAAVRHCIQLLPHDLRVVILLSVYDERPHAEIAGVLNTTPKAVESRLYRAKQILRDALEKWQVPKP